MPHPAIPQNPAQSFWAKARRPATPRQRAYTVAAALLAAALAGQQGIHGAVVSACGSGNVPACYAAFKQSDRERAALAAAFAEAIRAAGEKQRKAAEDAQSRTRLAEAEWGRPYRGPVAAAFAGHSAIRMPLCPPGMLPAFFIGGWASTPGAQVEYAAANGYWLFDLYHDTAEGKVYARPPASGTLTTLCRPDPPAAQGGRP